MKKNLLRILWLILGFAAIGIGAVGVILPVLPTTPFLLLASFCLAKGSEKFHTWFTGTKTIQKSLGRVCAKSEYDLKDKVQSASPGIGHAALSLCSNAELVWEGIYHIPYHL